MATPVKSPLSEYAGKRLPSFAIDHSVTDPDAPMRRNISDITDAALTASNFYMPGLGSAIKAGLAGVAKSGIPMMMGAMRKVPSHGGALTKYVDAFHGTKTPEGIVKTDQLLPGGGELGIQSGNAYGNGVYSSSIPETASNRAYTGTEGAVLPLKIDVSKYLDLRSPTKEDYEKINRLAESLLLPGDKSRLSPRASSVVINNKDDAHDFFVNQLKNWQQFGDNVAYAKPKATQLGNGFKIDYTDYDAPISAIDSPDKAEALLKTLGWDNVASMGYPGHILPRSNDELWYISNDPSTIRSRFAKFDPEHEGKVGLGLKAGGYVPL